MKESMKKIFSCIFSLWATIGLAQENIPIDSWRLHVSYSNINSLVSAGERIYASSNNGIFYYDRTDNSLQTITKINGLSDVGITSIGYSADFELIIVGYSNGNIDVLTSSQIVNINTIKMADILGSKRINDISTSEKLAYLSTDFGIVVLDLGTMTLKESIINLGVNGSSLAINDAALYNDSLFLATTDGIIAATLNDEINILDFNAWKRFVGSNGAPINNVQELEFHNGKLYAANDGNGIFTYDGFEWSLESYLSSSQFNQLFSSGVDLLITTSDSVWKLNGGSVSEVNTGVASSPNATIVDELGNLFVADGFKGLVSDLSGQLAQINPSGPSTDQAWKVYYHNNQIFALPGGIGPSDLPSGIDGQFSIFNSGLWTNYTDSIIPNDIVDIAYDASTGKYVLASFGSGIILFDGVSEFEVIDNSNSPLELSGVSGNILISTLAVEDGGVLVGNYDAINTLHYFKNEVWESYQLPGASYLRSLTVAANGDKWIPQSSEHGGGVYIFNRNSGKGRLLNSTNGNGGLPNSIVHTVAIDHEGLVWLGTERGLAFFNSTLSIENNNSVSALTPLIDGFPVLRDEVITKIKIDGGNRKWVGTENGVWLFDESVQNQIHHFNVENSPLLSNVILDIEIEPNTGEVFFATDKGIASFRSDATEGNSFHGEVSIFPNPVTADFQGKVGIKGLANNAIVKITDISGRMVRQMRANGASASWDVNNYQGRRVTTGTYFVFSSSEDGEETFIGKIAVIN